MNESSRSDKNRFLAQTAHTSDYLPLNHELSERYYNILLINNN